MRPQSIDCLFMGSMCCAWMCVAVACGAEPPVTAIACSSDGSTVIVGSQSGVKVLSWPELAEIRALEVAVGNTHDIAFSPSGDRLAIAGGFPADEGMIEVFSWPQGKRIQSLVGHTDTVMSVAWLDDLVLASAALDRKIVIWDVAKAAEIRSLNGHSRGICAICYVPQESILVSAGLDQNLRVWNTASGKLTSSLPMHIQPVRDVVLRPGTTGLPLVASVSADHSVRFWQPTIGRMVRFVKLPSKPLAATWLVDGTQLAVACEDGHVRLIDPGTVEVNSDFSAIDGWAYAITVHPGDGAILVGGSDGQIRLIDGQEASQ